MAARIICVFCREKSSILALDAFIMLLLQEFLAFLSIYRSFHDLAVFQE